MAQRPDGVTPEEWRVWQKVQSALGTASATRQAARMTPEQRSERARAAAATRWAKTA